MSNELSEWLSSKLQQRGWSHNELARRAGVSQSAISGTLSGVRKAGADFCIKVAVALDESPEKVLRLATILPPLKIPEDDPLLVDAVDILHGLSTVQLKEVVRYLRFLKQASQE